MKVPELKTGQMVTIAYILAIIIVLYIVYKVLNAVGLLQTGADKRKRAEEKVAINMLSSDEYFDPEFYKTEKPFKQIGSTLASDYAGTIHYAIYGGMLGRFNTDYNLIFTTMNKLYNKCNISELAEAFLQKYNLFLQNSLLNNLNGEHIADLMNIINALPDKN